MLRCKLTYNIRINENEEGMNQLSEEARNVGGVQKCRRVQCTYENGLGTGRQHDVCGDGVALRAADSDRQPLMDVLARVATEVAAVETATKTVRNNENALNGQKSAKKQKLLT